MENKELKVKDFEGLFRVPSGAIVNKDSDAYKRHIVETKRLAQIQSQEQRINNIESELGDIKSLLKQILEQGIKTNGSNS